MTATARARHISAISVTAAIVAAAISSCNSSAYKSEVNVDDGEASRTVVVSIPPLEYFVEKIGGDRVETICLAPASADPETFEPSMAQLRAASQARLMLTVGLLPFEQKVAGAINDSNHDICIVSLSDSIELIEGTHDHGGHHGHNDHDTHHHDDTGHGPGNYDPHVWTSLRNARVMARNTYHALVSRFPTDSLYFRQRLNLLDHHLDSLDRSVSARIAPFKGKTFLVWHPSLSYFARDYGLEQLAIGHEHKESSITGLKERLDRVRREKPLVFFYQREYDSRQAQTISDATGLSPVVITPLSPDIEEAVNKAADALCASSPRLNLNIPTNEQSDI